MKNNLIFYIFGFIVFLIFILISSSIALSRISIDLERKIYDSYCDYAIKKGYISLESYAMKHDLSLEDLKDSNIVEKDLCIDVYVDYLNYLTK